MHNTQPSISSVDFLGRRPHPLGLFYVPKGVALSTVQSLNEGVAIDSSISVSSGRPRPRQAGTAALGATPRS